MRYDERNKILYTVNPMAQVAVGRFFGYMRVWGSYADTVQYNPDKHEVKFNYNSLSKWDKLVQAIR